VVGLIDFEKVGKIYVGPEAGNCVGPYAAAVDQKRNRIYVSCIHSPDLAIIDGEKKLHISTIRLTDLEYHAYPEVAWSPVTGYVYVSCAFLNSVWVVDGEKSHVLATLKPCKSPQGIAVDSITGNIYIASGEEGKVAVMNKEGKHVTSFPVKPRPYGIAVDSEGKRAYVACQLDTLERPSSIRGSRAFKRGALCIVDTESFKLVREIDVGRQPRAVAVNNRMGKVYVTNTADNTVSIIDARTGTMKAGRVGCEPFAVAVNQKNDHVYVINLRGRWADTIGQPGTITVIDGKTDEIIKEIKVIGKTTHHVAVNPVTNKVYAIGEDNSTVTVINGDKEEVATVIEGLGLTVDDMAVNPRTGRIYIPAHFMESCMVADGVSMKKIARVHLKGWTTGAAVNKETNLVYVTVNEAGSVAVIDGASNKVVDEINLGVGCNLIHRIWSHVAVDSKRNMAYVSLARYNGLAVIDGEINELIARIKLGELMSSDPNLYIGSGLLAVAVNEETNRVYTLNPQHRCLSTIDGENFQVLNQLNMTNLDLPVAEPGITGPERRGSPFGNLAVDPVRNLVYVWNWIVNGKSNRLCGRLPKTAGNGVSFVDTARQRLYVHSIHGLTVLDAETYETLGNLEVESVPGGGSELRTMYTVDPNLNRLYVVRNLMVHGGEIEVYQMH